MCNLPKDHYVQVPWTKGHWPLDDLWPLVCWGHMCDSTQGLLWLSPMKIHQSMWIQWPSFQKLEPKVCWGHMCDSTQGSFWPSPMKIHQSMLIQRPFFSNKKLNQRSLTPRWPLTPNLLRSHVWLYPRIIVSKSHENTSKYVDTVTLFSKTWTKGLLRVTLPKDHFD